MNRATTVYDQLIARFPAGTCLRGALLAALVSASAILMCGCTRDESKQAQGPAEVSVTVTNPVQRDLPRFIRVTGTLYGDQETTVAAKVAGRVVEIMKDLGDEAQPGEALLRIDPTDYELALAERQRAFVESLAQLGLTQMPEGEFNVELLPSVERARLQAENAKARFERGRVLAEREPPLISEQDFADLRTTWDVAQSNLKVERLTAEATLAEARTLEAQVRTAEQRVRDAVHRAPVMPGTPSDGAEPSSQGLPSDELLYEVAERRVTVGDFVQIGAPLMRLVDSNPLKLRVSVPERRLGAVKIGQPVTVRLEGFTEAFGATVSRVGPAVDTATRAFAVEILLSNNRGTLKPGSFAAAEIEVERQPAVMIPETAVLTFAGVHKVVLVKDGKAQEKRVELGERSEQMVEIRSGVTAADQIVAKPGGSLTTGTPVRVVSDSSDDEARASRGAGAAAPGSGSGEATP